MGTASMPSFLLLSGWLWLNAQLLGRGYTWMNAGTFDSLRRATNFVCMIEQYQGMSISAPEEITYRFHWIDKKQLKLSAEKYGKSLYGEHLRAGVEDRMWCEFC